MNQKKIGGTKKKVTDAVSMILLLLVFCAFMFPFVMVIINSLKQKRDIIKSPFSWLFTIKGLSFDNFVKAFTQIAGIRLKYIDSTPHGDIINRVVNDIDMVSEGLLQGFFYIVNEFNGFCKACNRNQTTYVGDL